MCIYVCHDAAAFLNLEEAQSYFLFFFFGLITLITLEGKKTEKQAIICFFTYACF